MLTKDITNKTLDSLIGRIVYFMIDSHVIKGTISSYDDHQLFCSGREGVSKYSILRNKEFFFTEEELVKYLIRYKEDLTT